MFIYKITHRYYSDNKIDKNDETKPGLASCLLDYLHYLLITEQYMPFEKFVHKGRLECVLYDKKRKWIIFELSYTDRELDEQEHAQSKWTRYTRGNFICAYQRTYYNVFEEINGNRKKMSLKIFAKIFNDYLVNCSNGHYMYPTKSAYVDDDGSKLILTMLDPDTITQCPQIAIQRPNMDAYARAEEGLVFIN